MASRQVVEVLLRHLDQAWSRVQAYLTGLTPDEFAWSPVAHSWHLTRSGPAGRVTIPYAWKPPQPAPFTTIAWRMAHMAANKVLTLEHAFGAGQARLADLDLPADLDGMLAFLHAGQRSFRMQVEQLTDASLPTLRHTEWGEQRPAEAIITATILHDVEHGAQIAAVRELCRHWEANYGPALR